MKAEPFLPSTLCYDIVIATRNRQDALAASLPLMIAQSPPPERLIIIDASDEPDPVRAVVQEATMHWSGKVIMRRSSAGLPRQRNLGLAEVTAPIVFFMDDDSLLFPDTAAEILRIYDRDTEGRIAGVAAAEALVPPGSFDGAGYDMSWHHQREARTRQSRNWLERHLTVLKPAIYLGRVLNLRHARPGWLSDLDARPVEYMTGFRMTFRTDAIRGEGFDEALNGYALDEDIDASFTAMRSGLVVGAQRARIYHHRRPGGRGHPFDAGFMSIFNRAYVLEKHADLPHGSASLQRALRWRHKIFVGLKLVSILPKLHRKPAREVCKGALVGLFLARRQVWRRLEYRRATKTCQSQDISAGWSTGSGLSRRRWL